MNIYAVGTSHKHSPLDVRERLVFSEEELGPALRDLNSGIAEEAAIVSTCNRTEIYIVAKDEFFHADQLKDWLCRWKKVSVPHGQLFALHDSLAARHLFEVASGMDSQVVGDIQIIGQVRSAYQCARGYDALGKVLNRLFSAALHTGKRVKTETDLFAGAVSISYVAVELARKIFHPIAQKRTLVIGAGETGELAARNLFDQKVRDISITNRTESRGRDLIRRLGFGVWMPFEELGRRLHEFDIVIVSTGARNFLITYDDARAAAIRRDGEPQLIVDISVPRNVDPRINSLSTVFCKDLNDLMSVVESNVERRQAELPRAEMIIADELAKFSAWCNLLPVTPVVAELKRWGEDVARAELEKNRHRFDPEDFDNVEKLVASVVRKIIGMPVAHLLDARADTERALLKAEFVRLLFNLEAPGNGEAEEEPPDQHVMPTNGAHGNGAANGRSRKKAEAEPNA